MSQSADTADADTDADEDVDVVLDDLFFMSSHHCYWTMQTQSDSGCVDFEKKLGVV